MIRSRVLRSTIAMAIMGMVCLTAGKAQVAWAADQATRIAHNEGDVEANSHDLVQGSHVEGHIAFLRTELGITPAEDPLWAAVAAAMREDVRNLQDAENRVSHNRPANAIEYLQNRVMFANLRAQGEERFLTALRPLYNDFSPQQKQTADELLIPNAPE